MKIQAQSSLLLRQALQKAAKCIDSKSTIAILSNVLLTQRKEDGQFFFVSATTDSELSIPAPPPQYRRRQLQGRCSSAYHVSVVAPIHTSC